MSADTPTTLALLSEDEPVFALEALPDDLLAIVFVEIGEDDRKWHPKHLVRVAFVSKRFLEIVRKRCWGMKLQQKFSRSWRIAQREGHTDWRALYKLFTYRPAYTFEYSGVKKKAAVHLPAMWKKLENVLQLRLRRKSGEAVRKSYAVMCIFDSCYQRDAEYAFVWRGFCPKFSGTRLSRHLFPTSGAAVANAPRDLACMFCGADCCDIASNRALPYLTNFKTIQLEAQARVVVGEQEVEVDLQPVGETRIYLCQQGHIWASWSCVDMNDEAFEEEFGLSDYSGSDDGGSACEVCGCCDPIDNSRDDCGCFCHFNY